MLLATFGPSCRKIRRRHKGSVGGITGVGSRAPLSIALRMCCRSDLPSHPGVATANERIVLCVFRNQLVDISCLSLGTLPWRRENRAGREWRSKMREVEILNSDGAAATISYLRLT